MCGRLEVPSLELSYVEEPLQEIIVKIESYIPGVGVDDMVHHTTCDSLPILALKVDTKPYFQNGCPWYNDSHSVSCNVYAVKREKPFHFNLLCRADYSTWSS